MNSPFFPLVPLALLAAAPLLAQSPRDPQVPVPVNQAPANESSRTLITPPAGENQRVYGPARASLVDAETAKQIADQFRAAYAKDGAGPRVVVYVNRALVEDAGLRLTARTEKFYESTSKKGGEDAAPTTTSDVSGENTYSAADASKPTLADQQTVREIERLFGRVFRNAGARLADQKTAAALLADQPGARLAGQHAAKERDALKQVADIAVEVLISSRNLTVRGVAGDRTYEVPDIQATAIRLSDAAVLGQAAGSDILGGQGSSIARQFGPSDITEATAFALMQDMLTQQ